MNDDFKEELKDAYAHIERLEAEAKSRTLDYLGQVGQLSEELEREKREAERAQDAHGVRFLNYLEETARLTDRIEQLEEEVKVWVNHTKTAVWSDSEECKMLTEDNDRLRAALRLIAEHPVEQSGQWEIGSKEMLKVARAALEGK